MYMGCMFVFLLLDPLLHILHVFTVGVSMKCNLITSLLLHGGGFLVFNLFDPFYLSLLFVILFIQYMIRFSLLYRKSDILLQLLNLGVKCLDVGVLDLKATLQLIDLVSKFRIVLLQSAKCKNKLLSLFFVTSFLFEIQILHLLEVLN